MYQRAYNSFQPEPTHSESPPCPPEPCKATETEASCESPCPQKKNDRGGLLGQFQQDDILLLAVIFLLLQEDSEDKSILLVLAFLFFGGL